MPRGRKPKVDPPIEWAIMVPQSLAARVELLLYDPAMQKTRYAARSTLIVGLLQEWLDSRSLGDQERTKDEIYKD